VFVPGGPPGAAPAVPSSETDATLSADATVSTDATVSADARVPADATVAAGTTVPADTATLADATTPQTTTPDTTTAAAGPAIAATGGTPDAPLLVPVVLPGMPDAAARPGAAEPWSAPPPPATGPRPAASPEPAGSQVGVARLIPIPIPATGPAAGTPAAPAEPVAPAEPATATATATANPVRAAAPPATATTSWLPPGGRPSILDGNGAAGHALPGAPIVARLVPVTGPARSSPAEPVQPVRPVQPPGRTAPAAPINPARPDERAIPSPTPTPTPTLRLAPAASGLTRPTLVSPAGPVPPGGGSGSTGPFEPAVAAPAMGGAPSANGAHPHHADAGAEVGDPDGDPGETVTIAVTGTPPAAVRLRLAALRRHTVIVAGSGTGKTVLLRRLVEECALRGVSSVVLDPTGELARLGDAWPSPPALGWGRGDADLAGEYHRTVDVLVWTPGRADGQPLRLAPGDGAAATSADELLTPAPGRRARVSVVSLVGLATDEQRQAFVDELQRALLDWAGSRPAGGRRLTGLLVLDEAQAFASAGPATPCTDSTLALVEAAGTAGLGLVFATQYPTGLHPRVAAAAATLFLGRMNAPAHIDAARALAAAHGGEAPEISRLGVGEFYAASDDLPVQRVSTPLCLTHHPGWPLPPAEVLARARRP